MIKCEECGKEIDESFNNCPYCGNSLSKQSSENICDNCGNELASGATFCPFCGKKIENKAKNICINCGVELSENSSFCPKCGFNQNELVKCSNCNTVLEEGSVFCPECGMNAFTGQKSNGEGLNQKRGFIDKINLNNIIKPTLCEIVVAVILASFGLLIGLSWVSFIPAIILSVGFFAGIIDNEANAIVSGLVAGLILGILENPLVEIVWGTYAARFYYYYFGGQILILIIIGVVVGYLSNIYLKDNIKTIVEKHFPWLLL